MKKIYTIITISLLALLLSACGSGDAEFSGTSNSVDVVSCDGTNGGTNDCNATSSEYFTCLQSGDVLVKDIVGTTVTIVDIDQTTKKVCVDTGAAHIVR